MSHCHVSIMNKRVPFPNWFLMIFFFGFFSSGEEEGQRHRFWADLRPENVVVKTSGSLIICRLAAAAAASVARLPDWEEKSIIGIRVSRTRRRVSSSLLSAGKTHPKASKDFCLSRFAVLTNQRRIQFGIAFAWNFRFKFEWIKH